MQTRDCNWYDSKANVVRYGLVVKVGRRWLHAIENGKPCIYDTEKERDKKRAQFRKMKSMPQPSGD